MNTTVKFNEELMNLIEKVRLNLVGMTTDSLGAILTKLNSYNNPSNIVFNNIDELALEYNPDFKIYYSHLPHLNNLKNEEFKLSNQFVDCNHKFKNILIKNENIYTYLVKGKNLMKGKPKLPDVRIINGFVKENITIYYDNYLNFSIFVRQNNGALVSYYLLENTVKFPIFCFYCCKARNLQSNCLDYNNFKNNLIDQIQLYLNNNSIDLVKEPTYLIKYFVDYFSKYVEIKIPKTRSLNTYKNYLCSHKYNLESLKCLRNIFELVENCNKQLLNQAELDNIKDLLETKTNLGKVLNEKINLLETKVEEYETANNFLEKKLITLSEEKDKLLKDLNKMDNDNNLFLLENKKLKCKNKLISFISILLILSLSFTILFINTLDIEWDIYYEIFNDYYKNASLFLEETFNNTVMYNDDDFYSDGML